MIMKIVLIVAGASSLVASTLPAERRINLERAVDQCYAELIDQEIPEHCARFFGPDIPSAVPNKEVTTRNLCKRRVYLRYLSGVPGMFAREMEIKGAGECAKFWVSQEGMESFQSARMMLTAQSPVAEKAAFTLRMLCLVEKLHEEGFGHGTIDPSSFAVVEGRWYSELDYNLGALVMGNLLLVKSIYHTDGTLDMDGLFSMKQDLYQFWRNIVNAYFPQSAVSEAFLVDVEKVNAKERNFDFSRWRKILVDVAYGDTFSGVGSPATDRIVVDPTESLVSKAFSLVEGCRQKKVCRLKSSNKYRAEFLGSLSPKVVAGSSERLFSVDHWGAHKYVKLFETGFDRENHCWQESVLRSLDGLNGLVPGIYRLEQPHSMRGCSVVEVYGSMIDIPTMFSPHQRTLLYKTLASAIRGLEQLHKTGFLYLGFGLKDGVEFLADGALRFTNLQNVAPYVDVTGHHLDRSSGRSRKVDLSSLARVTASLIGDRDPQVDELIFAVDALGWEETPNYAELAHRMENATLSSELVDSEF